MIWYSTQTGLLVCSYWGRNRVKMLLNYLNIKKIFCVVNKHFQNSGYFSTMKRHFLPTPQTAPYGQELND